MNSCQFVIIAAVWLASVALGGAQSAGSTAPPPTPPTPVFATNYHVRGLLSLPYAELDEPFDAFYDKQLERSRTSYYGGEYQVYQFGPKSSPAANSTYGSIYKLVYVPADFHWSGEPAGGPGGESRAHHLLRKAVQSLPRKRHAADQASGGAPAAGAAETYKTPTKRACFGVQGGVGFTISAQSVLPKLDDFQYDSVGRCPHVADSEHRQPERRRQCELWKLTSTVGDKKNVYKFWLRRDEKGAPIPVHYYMLGYDSLLGSHYDRYEISYFQFEAGAAGDADFKLDVQANKCGAMPGPGADSGASERRAQMVVENPIHAYVVEPHRYDHIDHHFDQFKAKFSQMASRNKYASEQQERRGWFNFMHNLRFIHGKNRELKEFKLEVNQFADENVRELRYLRGRRHSKGYNGGLDYAAHHPHLVQGDQPATFLPDSFDWTALGAVTPVKDQAVCGSCWSFGTSGAVEGAHFVQTGRLLRLSQQQLIDCSWQFGNNGCDGGEDFRAYKYLMKAGGMATEEDYGQYRGTDGRCHDQDVERPVKIKGFYNVTANSVEALQHAILNHGPVSISIDASRPTFTFYSHGAYYDDKCQNSPDSLDHSVLAVGFTKINGKLVWKVKNSWSTYWGNDGYIYMAAENNNCGVLDSPTVPIIDA